MNKNTIIALVVGLIIGGLAIWLFMFFAQGTSMGTAIGLGKSQSSTGTASTDFWTKYGKYVEMTPDGKSINVKGGASMTSVDQSTVEIITPSYPPYIVKCACPYNSGSCSSTCYKQSAPGGGETCNGTCRTPDCTGNACLFTDSRNVPLQQQGEGQGR